ncbi:cobalamin biosynthesis protein [Pseudopelagicola sp. nBUS_19]|uniref:cobalamin biosynthesis protein n=1 Tax=Pseudopelagicola sp. nBUS_19 TaxID=3395316 RepID=UPI003EB877F8
MIVAGFGFRGEATVTSLRAALAATRRPDIEMLAAPTDKILAQALQELALELSLPIQEISDDMMQAANPPTQSEHSLAHRNIGSVAEACALAAAGPQAKLLTNRKISSDRMATCAIAMGALT